MHSQVHQRNQGFQRGIQLSSIQNISVGLKYAGQNLQEAKDIGKTFRIAGEDLGLDITQEEVEGHIERISGINNYRESIASSPTTRVSTPSEPSIIRPRPSPYQPGSRDQEIAQTLAESLNIRDPMSHTLTMPVPAGTINPITGHVNEDDAALFRAIGPDQADPPCHDSALPLLKAGSRWKHSGLEEACT
jgi:hypothetical protein